VRSDEKLRFGPDFVPEGLRNLDGQMRGGASHSGNERNHLFLNLGDGGYADVSSVSGLDDPADGRVFALLDFDRDGFLDVALANASRPLFELYRSELRDGASGGNFVALRFVGANHGAQPAERASNRDGIGARVELDVGPRRLVREQRAGDGFATQNSATLQIGIGGARQVDRLRVVWPSGRVQVLEGVDAGQLLTLYENAGHSPDGSGYDAIAYRAAREPARPQRADAPEPRTQLLADLPGSAELRLLTSMATWCTACREEIPQLRALRDAFGPAQLDLYAVPVDPDDSAASLDAWLARERPPYRLLSDLSPQARADFEAVARDVVDRDALPTTLVTDREGRILYGQLGPPSVSDLRRIRATHRARALTSDAAPHARAPDSVGRR